MLNTSINEVLARHPLAGQVLSRHGVEFCCAGDLALGVAIERANADAERILQELRLIGVPSNESPDQLNDSELIDYILQRFHQGHRRELPQLIQWADKVERVHARHANCPQGLAELLRETMHELENHMHKEEEILFPMLAAGLDGMALMPMHMMRREHISHEQHLRLIEATAHQFVLPDDACRTWNMLYRGLQHLVTELRTHIALENDLLFKRFGG